MEHPGADYTDDRFVMSEEDMVRGFSDHPLDIWVNSFGGCRHNYVRELLEDEYETVNQAYETKACHYVRPLPVAVQYGVFCYNEDVGIALTSQIKRGFYHNFIKLRDDGTCFSIENWLLKIEQQVDNWTSGSEREFPLVVINTDKIVSNKDMFCDVFGVHVSGFKPRETAECLLDISDLDVCHRVNERLKDIADFAVL